jgi:hypothetical protein
MITALQDNGPDTTDTASGRALHKNFSLFALKPMQFELRKKLVLGVETGVGYALSDENNIGLGFISEYNGKRSLDRARNISGKYFTAGANDRTLGISLNLTNFVAKGIPKTHLA